MLTGWRPSAVGPQRFGAALAEQGYSIRAFSQLTGIDRGTLSRVANGTERVGLHRALRMLEALDADWHHVWKLAERPRPGLDGWVQGRGAWQVRLRAEVRGRGLSPSALARRVGVCPETLRSWAAGEQQPSVTNLFRLCRVLRIHPADLFRTASA